MTILSNLPQTTTLYDRNIQKNCSYHGVYHKPGVIEPFIPVNLGTCPWGERGGFNSALLTGPGKPPVITGGPRNTHHTGLSEQTRHSEGSAVTGHGSDTPKLSRSESRSRDFLLPVL